MFKFLVLSALFAIAAAAPAPGYLHSAASPLVVVQQHSELAHVGSIVSHVPTAVSHQSRTDYHSTPVVKTIVAPVEYLQPVVHHHAPAAVVYSHAPALVHSVHAW